MNNALRLQHQYGFTRTKTDNNLTDALGYPTTYYNIRGNAVQSRLPSGYTELEYIESSGTQYIDTGIVVNLANSYKVTSNVLFSTAARRIICGSFEKGTDAGVSTAALNLEVMSSRAIRGYVIKQNAMPAQSLTINTLAKSLNTKILTELIWNSSTKVLSVSADGVMTTGTYSAATNVDGIQFRLFLDHRADPSAITNGLTMYDCKIEKDGMLVRNFIPAKNSSNVVGMYDLVTNQFFTNAGTGTFTAGAVAPTPSSPRKINGVGNSGLPSGYTKLQYLQSSGTQYINTGIIPSNTTGFKVKMSVTNTTTDIFRFGCRQDNGNTRFIIGTTSGKAYLGFGNGLDGTGSSPWAITSDVPFEAKLNYFNEREAYIDNVISTTSPLNDISSITFTYPLIMFGRNSMGTISSSAQRVYSCKITQDSTLVRDFVPARRDSDGALGMYDLVTNAFFGNAGSGTFTAGDLDLTCTLPIIKNPHQLPNEYLELSYLQSDGNQYINTGIVPLGTDSISITRALNSVPSSYTCHFGVLQGSPTPRMQIGVVMSQSVAKCFAGYNSTTYFADADTNWHTDKMYFKDGYYVAQQDDNTPVYYEASAQTLVTNPAWLFRRNDAITDGSGTKISSVVWNAVNGTPRMHLIPAKRIADNVLGMYDLVNGGFYTNQGTGSFTAGEVVGTIQSISLTHPLYKVGAYIDDIEKRETSQYLTRTCGVKIFDGTESFVSSGILDNCWTWTTRLDSDTSFTDRTCYCTHFKNSSTLPASTSRQGYCLLGKVTSSGGSYSVGKYVCFGATTDYTTESAFKSFLAQQYANGTPVMIVYPKGTSTLTSPSLPQIELQRNDNYIGFNTDAQPSSVRYDYRSRTK